MLSRPHALSQHAVQPRAVAGVERSGVEPQAGKYLGMVDSVRARRQVLELLAAADEPMDAVRIELHDKILANTGTLVVGLLVSEIELAAGAGDFDNQLGGTGQITFGVDVALATALGRDAKVMVRLRLALRIELDGRAVRPLRLLASVAGNCPASRRRSDSRRRDPYASVTVCRQFLRPARHGYPAASPRSARGTWAGRGAGRPLAAEAFVAAVVGRCSSWFPPRAGRGQLRREGCVFGGREALLQDLDQPAPILSKKRIAIQP